MGKNKNNKNKNKLKLYGTFFVVLISILYVSASNITTINDITSTDLNISDEINMSTQINVSQDNSNTSVNVTSLTKKEANNLINEVFKSKLKNLQIKTNQQLYTRNSSGVIQSANFNKYISCGDFRFAIYYDENQISFNNIGTKFYVFQEVYTTKENLSQELDLFIGNILDFPNDEKYNCNS